MPLMFTTLVQSHCMYSTKHEICSAFGPALDRSRTETRMNCEIEPDWTCKIMEKMNVHIAFDSTPFLTKDECLNIILRGKEYKCVNDNFEGTVYSKLLSELSYEKLWHVMCSQRADQSNCPELDPSAPNYQRLLKEKEEYGKKEKENGKQKDQEKEKEQEKGKDNSGENENGKQKDQEKGKDTEDKQEQEKKNSTNKDQSKESEKDRKVNTVHN